MHARRQARPGLQHFALNDFEMSLKLLGELYPENVIRVWLYRVLLEIIHGIS